MEIVLNILHPPLSSLCSKWAGDIRRCWTKLAGDAATPIAAPQPRPQRNRRKGCWVN